MAFQTGTKLVKCSECETENKFFKMFQSYRPDHAWKDEDTGRIMAVLFCVDCEVRNREKEWEMWTDAEKELAGESYPTADAVRRDQKRRAKEKWAERSEFVQAAKVAAKELREAAWSLEVAQAKTIAPGDACAATLCLSSMLGLSC